MRPASAGWGGGFLSCFGGQKLLFQRQTSGSRVTAKPAAASYDSMARDNWSELVGSHDVAHRSRSARRTCHRGQLLVGKRLSRRDRSAAFEHAPLEGRVSFERQRNVGKIFVEVRGEALEPHDQLLKDAPIVALAVLGTAFRVASRSIASIVVDGVPRALAT